MNEFRGVWVATVDNIDWPAKPGLSAAEQQAALRSDFDLFAALGLNAVIFQARTCCDAFFDSAFEPWSEFITGTQGIHPGYDPLQFAIEEAHKRGLQLHVWANPFRARFAKRLSPAAPNHISLIHPFIVKDYGPFQWLDPGHQLTHDYTLSVVREILQHYEVDGFHIDDYFYPYKVAGVPFPDEDSWALYKGKNGPLSRDDWRRDNVNRFVEALWKTVKETRPQAQFGISPFGIWRPGNPPGITGLDQYAELYADAKLWLQQGWIDYFTPQLYWKIDSAGQSFPKLLSWWQEQNREVPIWPGLYTSRIFDKVPWSPMEIVNQIKIARDKGAMGHIHFSAKALRDPKMAAALGEIYK